MLREERIDALLESAQTQSYNTAMELGQRGIRFVILVLTIYSFTSTGMSLGL